MDDKLYEALVSIRREIHQTPELGYQEFNTSKIICHELDKVGISYRSGIAKTGVIATMEKGTGPCIALRADMDALPIQEETGLEFASKINGQMHACGHDVHTTVLLGAIHLLNERDFNGTIKFIFQPSEEGNYDDPDKKSGGQRIVEGGELQGVSAALGLHIHPLLPAGKIAYKIGNALACVNFFKIVIHGKAGHAGAAPQLAIDAIYVSSCIIQSVQSIVSRYTSPTEPVVISFTKISGGTAPNIIADEVILEGTIRALDLTTYKNILNRLKLMMTGIEQTYGARIDLEYLLDLPSLFNDKSIHEKLLPALESTFGSQNVVEMEAMLGGEDFAFYSREVPSMFYFLGARADAGECFFVHHPKMVVNEECIRLGSELLANAAIQLLK